MTIKFERVTYQTEGQTQRTVRIEVVKDEPKFIYGYEVDREGGRVQPEAAYLRQHGAGDGNVLHVIEKTLITARHPLIQNRHTGMLTRLRRQS